MFQKLLLITFETLVLTITWYNQGQEGKLYAIGVVKLKAFRNFF